MSLLDKLNLSDKMNFDDVYNTFLGLERRQQIIAVSVAAVVVIVLLFIPVGCVSSKLNEKQEEYVEYTNKAAEFYAVLTEYAATKSVFGDTDSPAGGAGSDSLSRVIYSVSEQIGIRKNNLTLKSITETPSDLFIEEGKQVTVNNITFDQMVKLIEQLETYQPVPLTIKKFNAKSDLRNKQIMKTVSFTIATIKPKS